MNLTPEEKAVGKENFYAVVGTTRRDFLKKGIMAGVVSGGGLGAFYAVMLRRPWAVVLFALIGCLFNPLWPVELTRRTWQVVEAIAAAAFIAGGLLLARRPRRPTIDPTVIQQETVR